MGRPITMCISRMQNDLKCEGETVLRYRIEYPVFRPNCPAARKLSRYYKTLALHTCRSVQSELYTAAVRQYRYSVCHRIPMPVYEVETDCLVSYQTGCVASLRLDRYEFTGGAHGNTFRSSQTWDLPLARPLRLEQLTRGRDPKQLLLEGIQAQIAQAPENYFDNSPLLAAQQFDPRCFYCTPEGVVVYYQQYEIAPYSSGIPEFFFPYCDEICDPQQLCGRARGEEAGTPMVK